MTSVDQDNEDKYFYIKIRLGTNKCKNKMEKKIYSALRLFTSRVPFCFSYG